MRRTAAAIAAGALVFLAGCTADDDGGRSEQPGAEEIPPAQLALAWLARNEDVIAIPKAVRAEHVRENRAALQIALDAATLASLDAMFTPPRRKVALEVI